MIKLKPEINTITYYIHIVILDLVLLIILKYLFKYDMLNFDMFWKVGVAIIIGDVTAHSLLELD